MKPKKTSQEKRFMVALPYEAKKTVKDMANEADCTIAEIIMDLIKNASPGHGKRRAA